MEFGLYEKIQGQLNTLDKLIGDVNTTRQTVHNQVNLIRMTLVHAK